MNNDLQLAIELVGKDNASAAIGNVDRALGGLGGVAAGAAKALAGVAVVVGGAVVAGLGFAVSKAADFQKTLSGMTAVMDPKDVKQYGGALHDLAITLGAETAFSATEAASAMEELVKGGIDVTTILGGGARAALNLAAAGGIEVAEAATIASNAVGQFGQEAEAFAGGPGAFLEHAADLIAGAANASSLEVTDFKFSMQQAGATAAAMGVKFDDFATAVAVVGKSGITGSNAGTSLKMMFSSLAPATDKAAGEMERLGIITFNAEEAMKRLGANGIAPAAAGSAELYNQTVRLTLGLKEGSAITAQNLKDFSGMSKEVGLTSNSFFDASGKVKDLASVSQILQDATKNLSEEQRIQALRTIFGNDAMGVAGIVSREGAKGITEMYAAMGDVTAAEVAAARLDNLKGNITALEGSVETAAIVLGEAFLPLLSDLAKQAAIAVNAALPFLKAWGPQVAEAIGEGLAGVQSFVAYIPTLLATARPVIEAVQIQFEFFADVVKQALGGDVMGALKALIGGMAETRVDIITSLIGWAQSFIEWVAPMASEMLGELDNMLQDLLGFIGQTAVDTVEALGPVAAAFIDWVGPQIPGLLRELGAFAASMYDWLIGTALPAILTKLGEWGLAFVEWVAPRIGPLVIELLKLSAAIVHWMATTAIPRAIEELVKLGAKFVEWVGTEVLPKLPGALAEIIGRIQAWIRDEGAPAAKNAAVQMGTSFVSGIGAGIDGQIVALQNKIRDAVGGLVTSGARQLRAESPSKETAEKIGEPFIQGIIEGMNAETPRLLGLTQQTLGDMVRVAQMKTPEGEAAFKELADRSRNAFLDGITSLPGLTDQTVANMVRVVRAQLPGWEEVWKELTERVPKVITAGTPAVVAAVEAVGTESRDAFLASLTTLPGLTQQTLADMIRVARSETPEGEAAFKELGERARNAVLDKITTLPGLTTQTVADMVRTVRAGLPGWEAVWTDLVGRVPKAITDATPAVDTAGKAMSEAAWKSIGTAGAQAAGDAGKQAVDAYIKEIDVRGAELSRNAWSNLASYAPGGSNAPGGSGGGGGASGSGGGSGDDGGSTGNDGRGIAGANYQADPDYQRFAANAGWHAQVPGKGPLDFGAIDYDPLMDTERGHGTAGTNKDKSGHYRALYRVHSLFNAGHERDFMSALGSAVEWVRANTPRQFWGGLGWTIDGRAAGGPVLPGRRYLVGERGPELLSMGGQGGHVTPNGGGATYHITVNVAGSVATEGEIVRGIRDGLIKLQRQNGSLGLAVRGSVV